MKRTVLKVVEACHFVCCGDGNSGDYNTPVDPSKTMHADARRCWVRWDLAPTDRAVVAYQGRKIVGWFRYYDDYWEDSRGWFLAAGTWVHPDCRGQGIGVRLWKRFVKEEKSRRIGVVAVSEGGRGLTEAIRRLYPRIKVNLE